eukprot:gnl/TRDRNA2_/TRDRNA2_195199_c0_seq1.p1 gnl/TRDRNA2_/TRDRNA2_195199_c0~~gnl/TRDRNA2_/TRDRNA2_195199_c0_seq1.p1  ORF type:complete len:136 (-),score=18.93 gnl/TRDRNA2_/TRDRNA2_195199_c0_seq1:63-470(-)
MRQDLGSGQPHNLRWGKSINIDIGIKLQTCKQKLQTSTCINVLAGHVMPSVCSSMYRVHSAADRGLLHQKSIGGHMSIHRKQKASCYKKTAAEMKLLCKNRCYIIEQSQKKNGCTENHGGMPCSTSVPANAKRYS